MELDEEVFDHVEISETIVQEISSLNCSDFFPHQTFAIHCLESIENLKSKCEKLGLRGNFNIKISRTRASNKRQKKAKLVQEEYEVEDIVDYKIASNNVYYFVKWKDWDPSTNTWEPIENLTDCAEILENFKEKNYLNKTYEKPLKTLIALQLFLTKITSDTYNDAAILLKLCNIPLDSFHGKSVEFSRMRKTIKEKGEILSQFLDDAFDQDRVSATAILNYVCRDLHIYKHFETLDDLMDFVEERKKVRLRLKQWEEDMNKQIKDETDCVPIAVENNVDLEGPPENFTYITSNKVDSSVIFIDEDPPLWCECEDCYDNKGKCCPKTMDAKFAYSKTGVLKIPPGNGIYECNTKCKCKSDCPNRVVQKGRQHKLAIFRTDNGCGWGVKAIETIPKGRFVMEYMGEVITVEEADRRGKEYDAEGRIYLFDLDFAEDGESMYAIDAAYFGDISHFVNHSCDPNLEVYVVWINNYNVQLSRIAFFSKRCIRQGEQLTFDYKMTSPYRHNEASDYFTNVPKPQPLLDQNGPKVIVESLEDTSSPVPLEKSVTCAKSGDDIERISLLDQAMSNDDAMDNYDENRSGKNNIIMETGTLTPITIIQGPPGPSPFESVSTQSGSSNICNGESTDMIKPVQSYSTKRILCKCGSDSCRKYLL